MPARQLGRMVADAIVRFYPGIPCGSFDFIMEQKKSAQSRTDALSKIKEILTKGDVEKQFADRSGEYHSSGKFIVTWLGTWNGMTVEFSIDKVDHIYTLYSGGIKAVYARRNLFSEKQLESYNSIERALIDVGIKLCPNRAEKEAFYNQFAVPYNERLKLLKDEKGSN